MVVLEGYFLHCDHLRQLTSLTFSLCLYVNIFPFFERRPIYIYIYINKDENPSTKSTRHVDANVNTQKDNQGHQNNSNLVKDVMLKGHPMPQIS